MKDNTICMTESPLIAQTKVDIGSGDFNYIESKGERVMLQTAFQAITITKNWDFIKNSQESFIFNNDKRVEMIYTKIENLGYHGHSGCSFALIMRHMQFIAQNGEKAYKEHRMT